MTKPVFQESRSGALGEAVDGSYPVTLLTPGQGASAYYSEEVIRRDAAAAFPKGTHVYLNHLQEGETRSPDKILGTLIEDTTFNEAGAAVNRFLPVNRWKDLVEDVHKIAGLSINAAGSAKLGMVDGRTTRVAESIDYHLTNSVDLVSYPGRPGSGFTESYDALYAEAMAASGANVQTDPSAPGVLKEGKQMEMDEKLDKLIESVTALTSLVESAAPKAPKQEELDAAADRTAAIDAIRAVESAEVSASVKDKLIEGIKAGDYAVEEKIAEHKALREELTTEIKATFNESIVGAAGAAGGAEAPKVIGWGS